MTNAGQMLLKLIIIPRSPGDSLLRIAVAIRQKHLGRNTGSATIFTYVQRSITKPRRAIRKMLQHSSCGPTSYKQTYKDTQRGTNIINSTCCQVCVSSVRTYSGKSSSLCPVDGAIGLPNYHHVGENGKGPHNNSYFIYCTLRCVMLRNGGWRNALNKTIDFAHKRNEQQRYVLVCHIHFNNLQNQFQTQEKNKDGRLRRLLGV